MTLRISGFLLLAAVSGALASQPPPARWEGTVRLPGREIKVVVDLAQNTGGQWIGSAILPGFGVKGVPLSDVAVTDSSVSFVIKGVLGDPKFEGVLNSSGTLAGEFKQAGNSASLTLQNIGAAQVELPPVSTAVRKELEGEWKGDMSYGGNPIHVTIKLANQAGGKATGQFVIVGKRETTLPIDLITQEGEMLTVEMYERGMTYEGRFLKEKNEINGEFRQGPVEIPLTLHPAVKV
jgi:hypothetical protein